MERERQRGPDVLLLVEMGTEGEGSVRPERVKADGEGDSAGAGGGGRGEGGGGEGVGGRGRRRGGRCRGGEESKLLSRAWIRPEEKMRG
ncbi:hypothetical protein [Oryza sativa Japonica Group]|uniref:Uncharacterized protein n=2 Tax=Oryza sativa subsp. japonica TaxID=39947 RepID=Q7F646_ORYSJ|nr:hypothetical protein [Oryza sativa Japonica Group]BAB60924.1 hypothetical protein [Oryza sativa Japonica Group]